MLKHSIKRIENLKFGIELHFKNSEKLYNRALQLSNKKNYTQALPVLISSIEETIKGYALCMEVFLGDQTDINKLLKKSKVKQEVSLEINSDVKNQRILIVLQELNRLFVLAMFTKKALIKGNWSGITWLIFIPDEEEKQINNLIEKLANFSTSKSDLFKVKNDILSKKPVEVKSVDYKFVSRKIDELKEIFDLKIEFIFKLPNHPLALLYELVH